MRNKTQFIFLFVVCLNSFGQEKENFSIEIDANCNFYFISQNRKNYFNTAYSLLISYYNIEKLKLSTGINYSTKNSYYNADPTIASEFLRKRDYKLQYINIPIILSYTGNSTKEFKMNMMGGIVFNKIIKYDITSFYSNDLAKIEEDVKSSQKTGVSLRIGMNFSKFLYQSLILNLSPYLDYKLELDHNEYNIPNYKNLTNDRFSFGIKIGIEYLFK